MGLAWWLPAEESVEDFFKFLPRGDFKTPQNIPLADINQAEKALLKHTDISRASEIHAMIRLRESQKDQELLELKRGIDQLFIACNELSPPSTEHLISDDLHALLEDIHLLRSSLLDKIGG